ncbi:site-specific integrase [Kineococcus glutinatus]|uniref:site-specific integrase n=1 Tax=Kineococcus glutinatus TaxID=1070872 RepID=UPI0031EAF816
MARYYPTDDAPFRGRLPDVQPDFAAAREDFLYHLADDKHRADDTLRAYWTDLDDLLWWAEKRGKVVLRLTHDDLRSYLTLQRRRGYSHGTIRRRLTAFRGFYSFLLREGTIAEVPTAGLIVRARTSTRGKRDA